MSAAAETIPAKPTRYRVRPPREQSTPARHHAPMPAGRAAEISWLVVGEVLITPFPARPGGLNPDEVAAVVAMRRLLAGTRIGTWITPNGSLRAQVLENGPLEARRRAHACVRLRPDVVADPGRR
jgi:hypothetical protein